MWLRYPVYLTLPALAAFLGGAAISPAVAQTTVYRVQPAESVVVVAPTAPPPPMTETIPAPPIGSRETYWRPGHWNWDGANWAWSTGAYVIPPRPSVAWVPGHWVLQPTGGYAWVDGHWQG